MEASFVTESPPIWNCFLSFRFRSNMLMMIDFGGTVHFLLHHTRGHVLLVHAITSDVSYQLSFGSSGVGSILPL